jgi:hypothetical protein
VWVQAATSFLRTLVQLSLSAHRQQAAADMPVERTCKLLVPLHVYNGVTAADCCDFLTSRGMQRALEPAAPVGVSPAVIAVTTPGLPTLPSPAPPAQATVLSTLSALSAAHQLAVPHGAEAAAAATAALAAAARSAAMRPSPGLAAAPAAAPPPVAATPVSTPQPPVVVAATAPVALNEPGPVVDKMDTS